MPRNTPQTCSEVEDGTESLDERYYALLRHTEAMTRSMDEIRAELDAHLVDCPGAAKVAAHRAAKTK